MATVGTKGRILGITRTMLKGPGVLGAGVCPATMTIKG
jgi:hypothetical protein